VGFWTSAEQKDSLAEPIEEAANRVVATFAEAISVVRAIAIQVKTTAKTA
jgi:hypothetical protein